ncbi:MAG: glycosyltransferase [Bacilli bacterium]|nr:glycosyltransferase [Bacilli bacterium]
MKKVLFTATVDSHILQFHLPFLKLFKDRGYEVHVATNGEEMIPYCDVKHTICFERKPIKINNLKAIRDLKKIIDNEEFDIIHCHTPMGSVVTRLAAKKARRINNTRVIYTAHGFHFYKGASIINWLIFYPVEKYLAKYTDTLITINKEDYNLAKKKFSRRCNNIEYVPGVGIDPKKFDFKMTKKEKHDLRKSLGLKDNDFVMIYPAELNKNKNQIFLINVMEELIKKYDNIHLLLPGIDSYNGYYQKITHEKGLNNNIHFLGYRKDIPKLLKISNLSVSSSKREGLPVNVMEALICDLPVIALKCRGINDLIVNGKSGYIVNRNDKKYFINQIEQIYLNKDDQFGSVDKNIIRDCLLENVKDIACGIYFRKKIVLHILASNSYSGAENVVCNIIQNMKNEYDMIYCSPEGTIRHQLKERNIEFVSIKKISISQIRNVVKKCNPDIIHAHDNKATVLSSFYAKRYKVISHIHGNNKVMNSFNLKTLLFHICSKNICQFIWVSKSSFDDYYFKNKVEKKSIVLYNVVNREDIIKKSKEYVCNQNYDLIYLGRLGYPKNPRRFVEIVQLLKQHRECVRAAIVGDGPEKNDIEHLIDKLMLNDYITMWGYQDNPFPILKKSKILVMTSLYEGTPMSALEAQALGKPIIATPVDGLKEIINNSENGLLDNNNANLAKKIDEILSDNKKYAYMSRRTRETFKRVNNTEKYFLILKKIYDKNR